MYLFGAGWGRPRKSPRIKNSQQQKKTEDFYNLKHYLFFDNDMFNYLDYILPISPPKYISESVCMFRGICAYSWPCTICVATRG